MTTGLSATVANSMLDALCRSVAWTDPVAFYVKLYLTDPGSAGLNGAAGETDRVAATFSAATAGTITNSSALTWTAVSNAETYGYVGFWDASSGGNFLGSDQLEAPRTVAIGDNFTIAAGDLDLSLTPIAA